MANKQTLWSDLQKRLCQNMFAQILVESLLLFLLGPLPFIPLWKGRKQQPQRLVWYGWKHALAGAQWPLLLYSTLLYLHQPISWLWATFFVHLAAWTQKPELVWAGQQTLWPPSMDNLLFRWTFAWPLATFVSYLLKPKHQPIEHRFRRVLTPQDQLAASIQVQEKGKQKIHHSHRKSQSRRPRKTPSGDQIKQTPPKLPVVPAQNSLWGRTDWDQVPDTDPLKQQVIAAAQLLLQPPEATQAGAQSAQHTLAEPEVSPVLERPEQDDGWDIDKCVLKL